LGRPAGAVLPAPAGSDRAVAGMFTTVQCHHPLPVGASGS
jgi:hypothetical protein